MGLFTWFDRLVDTVAESAIKSAPAHKEPVHSAPAQQEPAYSAPTGWFMPSYDGLPICDWEPQIAAFKRNGDYDSALVLARGCMDAMVQAAHLSPENVMEHYVIQVLIIQHKMKDYAGEIATIESWLAHGFPVSRQDFDIDINKRLAKAREQLAKANGEDPSEHTQAWKNLVALQKQLGSSQGSVTGASKLYGAPIRPQAPTGWQAPAHILSQPTFVAVDFETANTNKVSACQIALVKIHDGQVVDRYSSLIKPPRGADDFEFTYLHGISAGTVRRAPQWPRIAATVSAFTAGLPTSAHNAPFDSGVWSSLDSHFGTSTRPGDFFCSYRTAQRLVPGLPNYKLPTVTAALVPGFTLDHHDASSDAEAAGRIVAALQRLSD